GLPPELLLVPLVGHTRGHTGIAIDTGRADGPRWLLHAGDAYFHRGQLDPVRPHCPAGLRWFQSQVEVDHTTRLDNVERLRELAASGEVQVFSAHDPVELSGMRGE